MSLKVLRRLNFCACLYCLFGVLKTDKLVNDDNSTSLLNEQRGELLLFSSRPNRLLSAPSNLTNAEDILSVKSDDKSEEDNNWGYNADNGPSNWPQKCHFGKHQSPINIDTRQTIRMTIPQLRFENYNRTFENISAENNGHSVTFSGFDQHRNETPYLYGGEFTNEYMLHQFHFHWSHKFSNGSEHTINRIHYPVEGITTNLPTRVEAEESEFGLDFNTCRVLLCPTPSENFKNCTKTAKSIHLVHIRKDLTFSEAINSTDGVVVLAVFGMIGEDGVAFEGIADKFANVVHRGDRSTVAFNPIELLPSDTMNFYRYDGSLTTPGCFETVDWVVFHEPIPITEQQLAALRLVEVWGGSDADTRPIQPINDRRIFDCFSVTDPTVGVSNL